MHSFQIPYREYNRAINQFETGRQPFQLKARHQFELDFPITLSIVGRRRLDTQYVYIICSVHTYRKLSATCYIQQKISLTSIVTWDALHNDRIDKKSFQTLLRIVIEETGLHLYIVNLEDVVSVGMNSILASFRTKRAVNALQISSESSLDTTFHWIWILKALIYHNFYNNTKLKTSKNNLNNRTYVN